MGAPIYLHGLFTLMQAYKDDLEPPSMSLRLAYPSSETASYTSATETPLTEYDLTPNPVYIGQMLEYFSRPGYRLGDALHSTYHFGLLSVYRETTDQQSSTMMVMGRRHTL